MRSSFKIVNSLKIFCAETTWPIETNLGVIDLKVD